MGVFAEQMRITMEAQAIGYQLGVDLSNIREPRHTNPDLPYEAPRPLDRQEREAILELSSKALTDIGENMPMFARESYVRIRRVRREKYGQEIHAVIFQFGNPETPPKDSEGVLWPFEGDDKGSYRGVALELSDQRAVVGVTWRNFDTGQVHGGPAEPARAFLVKPLFLFPKLATAITHSRQTAAAASGRTLT